MSIHALLPYVRATRTHGNTYIRADVRQTMHGLNGIEGQLDGKTVVATFYGCGHNSKRGNYKYRAQLRYLATGKPVASRDIDRVQVQTATHEAVSNKQTNTETDMSTSHYASRPNGGGPTRPACIGRPTQTSTSGLYGGPGEACYTGPTYGRPTLPNTRRHTGAKLAIIGVLMLVDLLACMQAENLAEAATFTALTFINLWALTYTK
jgi:hypothetical protein